MNYSPTGMRIWDAWYLECGHKVHMYHLQCARPGAEETKRRENEIGHAVTTDLIEWEERPGAFGPDPANPRDDAQPWTGCALWRDGRGYLYYTMRGSATPGEQSIALATATDPDRWTRHAGNPVIRPDPRWYATVERRIGGVVDCRDLIVVADPCGDGWFGFYAARRHADELARTSVIACVRSRDLIRWEHLPPAFTPDRYACIEVPDVFELNGRWYMTCLTGHWYGNRGIFSDPNLVNGTVYAVAERPEGPYCELADNALVAARTTGPISARSVRLDDERYVLYTDRERTDGTDTGGMCMGTVSTPKRVTTSGDRLVLAYSPRIEKLVTEELIGPALPARMRTDEVWGQIWQMPGAEWSFGLTISGQCQTGWSVAPLTHRCESFILEATVTLENAVAAGLALRMTARMAGAVVALDAAENVAFFAAAPAFDFAERRRTPVPRGKPIHLRVVNRLEHLEIYVNDELRLAFSRYAGIGGEVGLFVDRGRARFEGVRLRRLNVRRPT